MVGYRGTGILSIIKKIAGDGITMVIVTHEIDFAREVANRVVFMAEGVIVEQGSPEEVLIHPSHERTKQFLKRLVHEPEYTI